MTTDRPFAQALHDAVTDERVIFRTELGDYVVDVGQVHERPDGRVIVYLLEAGK